MDAISREEVLKPYKDLKDDDVISVWLIRKNIEQQKSVQPSQKEQEPKYWIDYNGHVIPIIQQKRGHWIQIDYQRGKFECSKCHTQGYVDTYMYEPKWNFCPICGADMKGEVDA